MTSFSISWLANSFAYDFVDCSVCCEAINSYCCDSVIVVFYEAVNSYYCDLVVFVIKAFVTSEVR